MIETIIMAIIRKVIFMGILFGTYKLIDNYYLKAFNTDEAIKESPLAISIIVAGIVIALAFA